MIASPQAPGNLVSPHTLFRLFKYAVYALLALNVYLFFLEDYAASAQTFGGDISWRNVVEAFSATIDTTAWVILLLLFELETAVISDAVLKGSLKWVFLGIRCCCYFFIVYAWYGYLVKLDVFRNTMPFTVNDVCSLIGSGMTYIEDLDDYLPIDPAACAAMNGSDLLQVAGTGIIGTAAAVDAAIKLAWIDVINATDWIFVVVLLEVEVFMQIRGKLTDRLVLVNKLFKFVLYSVLFLCAVYWGLEGDFLDFWDAFLWLVAFVFIEMNIFQWQEETAAGTAPA